MLKDTLVVSDLDGTLLSSNKTISIETQNYLKGLQDKGVNILLASGRPYRAIKPYYDQIGLNGYVVCYNGGMIIDPTNNDKIIFEKRFPKELVFDIINQIGKENFENVMVQDLNTIYLENESTLFDNFIYSSGMKIIRGHLQDNVKDDQLEVIFALKNHTYYNKLLELGSTSKYKDINIRFWHDELIAELYFNDINKYTSIEKVAKIYNLDNKDIICIGDADNDIEMIYRAGIGIGMKNTSSKFLKQTAKMLSLDDNDHDGVMKTLQLLIHDDDLFLK